MKKLTYYAVFCLLFLTSCLSNDSPLNPAVTRNFNEIFSVEIQKTDGKANIFDKSGSFNLSEEISNVDDISSIAVEEIKYQFKNFSGNTEAVAKSLIIKINDIEIASKTDLNINTVVSAGTIYTIDSTTLSSLENSILSNPNSTYTFSGSVLTDEGIVSFDLEVSIKLKASF
jgi:hypothetical protein